MRSALDAVCGALAEALYATAIGSQLVPGNPLPLSLRRLGEDAG